ncbi:hypothetical protein [[Kitasatospora] papulosa]|uniref:hypothetical protein n=1 Tax=[Kitasatospora] papulosa TaxID=1464011 RepID=UPI003691604E
MSMTFEQVQPDTRVILTAHGQKGTVIRKFMGGQNKELPVIVIDFDGVGTTMRTPDQLDVIDEPTPAPKLGRASKGVAEFYIGGEVYQVFNSVDKKNPVNGFWQVWRKPEVLTAAVNADCVISGAKTRKDAFAQAVAALTAA